MSKNKTGHFTRYLWITIIGLIVIGFIIFSIQNRTNGKITSGGETRKYLLYVPDSYNSDTSYPLVISLHGFVQWPANQKTMTGWNALADEFGFLVVYPQGTGFPLRWNVRLSAAGLGSENANLLYIQDLIEHLSGSFNIDPTRIYANGMSNGGGMAELLACELADQITAIGGVAGAYLQSGDSCRPDRPVPVIAFHGQDDQIVPYAGGPSRDEQFDFLPIEHWAGAWAERNGCRTSPEITGVNSEINRASYTGCNQDAGVILYSIKNGGHTWPGGDALPEWIAGYTNPDINASALMWQFFNKYSLALD
jgi:polyhydroxybutyrate depolymerase